VVYKRGCSSFCKWIRRERALAHFSSSAARFVSLRHACMHAVKARPYVLLSSLFQYLLEFPVLVFMVDAIDLSCLDVICSSTLLVCMFSLPDIFVVMIYQLSIWIKLYGNLLIYLTIQKSDYRQMNSSGVATATRTLLFDGSQYKRWCTRAVLWFQNMNCYSAPFLANLRVIFLLLRRKVTRKSMSCLRRLSSVFLQTTLLTRT
jgi:hypothetical protein